MKTLYILCRQNRITKVVYEFNLAYDDHTIADRWASYLNAHKRMKRYWVEELRPPEETV